MCAARARVDPAATVSYTVLLLCETNAMMPDRKHIESFRRRIWRFYRLHGRHHLPFRQTRDPYAIAVSEIMLQQTQVGRVIPSYEAWISRWPDWNSLAGATTRQLLTQWSGLGYNRRAIALGNMANTIVQTHRGELPTDEHTLLTLPGIGPYTARAVLIFAFDKQIVAVDTNIRRVILHEMGLPSDTSPTTIEDVARQLMPRGRSRNWHYALMDYSSLALPRRLEHIPPVSRQSKFEGSLRQIRGEIIRQLTTKKSVRLEVIARKLDRDPTDVRKAAEALARDGLIRLRGDVCRLLS